MKLESKSRRMKRRKRKQNKKGLLSKFLDSSWTKIYKEDKKRNFLRLAYDRFR